MGETKERPISFTPEMVRAILEGRKSQTRRVITPLYDGSWCLDPEDPRDRESLVMACRHGNPGDRLWVKETFMEITPGKFIYRAEYGRGKHIDRWQSPRFMPRIASRLTLEILSVRVERVQDISEPDAIAEGIENRYGHDDKNCMCLGLGRQHACEFMDEWDRINSRRGYDWTSNPWVWVISFKRITEAQ